ncbi:MAG: DUF58 domain-containing protein [Bacteroidia bacterium]
MQKIREIFLPVRFFLAGAMICFVFISGFFFPVMISVAQFLLMLLLGIVVAESIFLFRSVEPVHAERTSPAIMNLSDENSFTITVQSRMKTKAEITMIDELPDQFQRRNFSYDFTLKPGEEKKFTYTLRPVTRGVYAFGKIHFFVSIFSGMVQRRYSVNESENVAVYPSILQMKNMELKAFSRISLQSGIKRLRRIGHSYEFEQIKNYVAGDDIRSINWKATGRRAALMSNQYEDEKSQQVYFILDKSRSMGLPFNDLSLLDYSINTSLVMANIALRKGDKAGLISFGSKIETLQKADRTHSQLRRILQLLYKEKEHHGEANYEILYSAVRNVVRIRSMIILFTNFESTYAMERAMPVLRKINRFHLLVVVIFKNTEIENFAARPAHSISDIYLQTIAGKYNSDKEHMATQMQLYGIQTIYTEPEHLSVNVLNKYLELKARGMI